MKKIKKERKLTRRSGLAIVLVLLILVIFAVILILSGKTLYMVKF